MPWLRRHAHALVLLSLALAAVLVAASCSKSSSGAGKMEEKDDDAPVPVEFAALEAGPIEDTLRFSATLRAETQVQVLSRSAGQVQVRAVEEGDVVNKGQLLLRLDPEEQQLALRRIKNDHELARRNHERQKALHAKGVVSDQALENAEFELQRLAIARDDAALALRYTTVRAPVAGTVTQRMVERGDLVVPNQPLFELTDFDTLLAEVFVPEKDIGKISEKGAARLLAPATGDSLPGATVERIAPVVDPRSGTVKVTLDVPKGDDLRPGMFVDVELVVAKRDAALLLPRRALVYDNDEPYAFKVVAPEGDEAGQTTDAGVPIERVKRIRVVAGIEDRDHVVPETGFAAGDRVVVAGQVGLKDGASVAPRAAPDSAP